VSSPGASRVARVLAKPGQQVKQGELLLELDDREIRLALEALKEQLAQQENRIVVLRLEMEQKLKQIASAIELLEIDLQASRARRERNQKLRSSGLVSGEDLLTSELNVQRNEIQLRQQRELIGDTSAAPPAASPPPTCKKRSCRSRSRSRKACCSRPGWRRPSPAC
jgi:HlyD family secretion protein